MNHQRKFQYLRSVVFSPFQRFPEFNLKNKTQAIIFKHFGMKTNRTHTFLPPLPRRDLILNKGDNVLIIGADRPKLIHDIAHIIGADGEVIIFEPFKKARNKISPAAESYPNIKVDKRGIWSEKGTKTFFYLSEESGGCIKEKQSEENSETPRPETDSAKEVPVIPIDSAVREYDFSVDYLECFVNGTENEVLRSARNTLIKDGPRIMSKAYGYGTDSNHRVDELKSFLKSLGYNLVHSPVRKNKTIEPGAPDGDIFAWRPK